LKILVVLTVVIQKLKWISYSKYTDSVILEYLSKLENEYLLQQSCLLQFIFD